MNLGWIRNLFTLSEIEKRRLKEPTADPRRIESFQDLDALIQQSLTPAPTQTIQVTTHNILNDQATPKTTQRTHAKSLPDQDLLKKLLKHRPNYNSGRILRAGNNNEGTS